MIMSTNVIKFKNKGESLYIAFLHTCIFKLKWNYPYILFYKLIFFT